MMCTLSLSLSVSLPLSLLVSPVFRKEDRIYTLPEVDSLVCCAWTQAHTYAHIDTYT